MSNNQEELDFRRRRVNRIKKIIVGTIIFLLVFPMILSIILLCKVIQLENELNHVIEINHLISEQVGVETPAVELQSEEKKEQKVSLKGRKVYLTFDDGPSKETKAILDILKEKKVKATFFEVGHEDEESKAIYKRIVKEGHTLGMHSYSHIYEDLYQSIDGFQRDYFRISDYLSQVTGTRPFLYRFPGGSSNSVHEFDLPSYNEFLEAQGVNYMDWNVIAANGSDDNVSVGQMVQSVLDGVKKFEVAVVLLYDSADKKMTAKSLGDIIDKLKAEGCELLPIDEKTTPLHHS